MYCKHKMDITKQCLAYHVPFPGLCLDESNCSVIAILLMVIMYRHMMDTLGKFWEKFEE